MPSPLVFLKNGMGTTVFAIVQILPSPKRYNASAHNVSGTAVFSMDVKPHFSLTRRERGVFCPMGIRKSLPAYRSILDTTLRSQRLCT